jgi:signal transduction histidine kinase
MNPDLAGIIISNLIKNSIVHNIPDGHVNVHVSPTSFTICNTDQEKALDTEKIFNRFYKGVSKKNSTGLGLSIVKAIADLYGFVINYTYKDEHCIEVKFRS